MAERFGYIVLPVVPSMRGFSEQINQQLAGMMPSAGVKAGDQFTGGFSNALSGLGKAIGAATATAATAAGVAVAASLRSGWSRLTSIQDATSALSISLGDSAAAARLLEDVLSTVQGTPFNFDRFASAAQQMVGMGIEAEKVPGYLEAIGEASATQGGRAQEFADRLSTVFGQVASSGQLMLRDVWRISETGVNALAILSNHFGVTTAEMKKMISDGAVPAGQALDALAEGILRGSDGPAGATRALAGTMEALRQTMSGAIAGIEPAMARFGAALIEPFSPAIVDSANAVTKAINNLTDRATEWATELASSDSTEVVVDLFERLPRLVRDGSEAFEGVAPAASAALAGVSAFGLGSIPILNRFIPAVNPVAAAITGLVLATPEARAALGDLLRDIAPLVGELVENLAPVLANISEIAGEVLPPAIGLFGDAFKAALTGVSRLLDVIEPLTGFLADHSEIVMTVATAYAAWKAVTIGRSMWSGLKSASDALANFRLGLMGVTEESAGAANQLGGMTRWIGMTPGALGALGGAVALAGFAWNDYATKTKKAKKETEELIAASKDSGDVLGEFKDRLANLWAGIEGGFDVGQINAEAMRSTIKRAGYDLAGFEKAVTGTDEEWQAFTRAFVKAGGDSMLPTLRRIRGSYFDAEEGVDAYNNALRELGQTGTEPIDKVAGSLHKVLGALGVGRSRIDAWVKGATGAGEDVAYEALTQLEEQAEAIEDAMETASASFRASFDLLQLRDESVDPKQVESAEKAVRSAREQVAEAEKAASATGQTAEESERTAKALADARDRLVEANRNLQDLRASDSPLNAKKIFEFYAESIVSAKEFGSNYRTAIEAGYDPQLMSRLLAAGPEEAGELLAILAANTSTAFVEMVNDGETAINEFTSLAAEHARLTQMVIQETGREGRRMAELLPIATAIATAQMQSSTELSIDELEKYTGASIEEMREAARLFDIELIDIKQRTKDILADIQKATGLSTGQLFGSSDPNWQGARASGGPVWPGTWLVGEQGPELLTLGTSGHVFNTAETLRALGGSKETGKRRRSSGPVVSIQTAADAQSVGRVVSHVLRGY